MESAVPAVAPQHGEQQVTTAEHDAGADGSVASSTHGHQPADGTKEVNGGNTQMPAPEPSGSSSTSATLAPSSPTPEARRARTGGPSNGRPPQPAHSRSRSSVILSSVLGGASPSQARVSKESASADPHDTAQNQGESSSSWKLPSWASPHKRKKGTDEREPKTPTEEQAVLVANDSGDSFGPAEDAGVDFVDEGISMSDASGRVDFMTSLPLEISLYILLFADAQSICRASQVSKAWYAVTSDATLWRENFYRNVGWEIRPEVVQSLRTRPRRERADLTTPSKSGSSSSRQRRQTTGNEGTIASRIGRRIGDIVHEMGYLGLATAKSDTTESPPVPGSSTPSAVRTRSITAGSLSHTNPFIMTPTRRATTPDRPRLSGFGSAHGSEGDVTASGSRDKLSRNRRRTSTNTLLPFQPMSPVLQEQEPLSPMIDWKGLYRDRYELERRWSDGLFTSKTLKGHTDSVYCVALRGNTLISGSRDQTIKVWDLHSGTLIRTIEVHKASVLAIQYDDTTMVTGASNGELFVWDINTWEIIQNLTGHTAGVLDVQMNSEWIASCSKDTSLRVWKRKGESGEAELYRVLQGHRGPVNAIQLNGNLIVSGSGDASAKLWDIETGQVVRVFKGHTRGLACVQFYGNVLMTGSNDKTIRIWDPASGECVRVLKGHEDLVRSLAYDPLRQRIFSGSYDKTTRIWDAETGHLQMTFKQAHHSLVFDVGIDVSRLVSGSHDKRIVLMDFGEDLDACRFL